MKLGQLTPHLKAINDAIPQLSPDDKYNLSLRARNIVVRCGEDPNQEPEKESE